MRDSEKMFKDLGYKKLKRTSSDMFYSVTYSNGIHEISLNVRSGKIMKYQIDGAFYVHLTSKEMEALTQLVKELEKNSWIYPSLD